MMGPAELPEDDLETLSHSTQAHSADAVAAEARRDSRTIAEARQVRIISPFSLTFARLTLMRSCALHVPVSVAPGWSTRLTRTRRFFPMLVVYGRTRSPT